VEELLTGDSLEQQAENGLLENSAPVSRDAAVESAVAPSSEQAPGVGAGRRLIRPGLLIVGIMAAIAGCEYIFAYENVAYGIIASLTLVVLLYLFLTFRKLDDRLESSIESITLLPLYILFTSSLPWFFIHQVYLVPAVYSCVLGLCWAYIYQKQLDVKQIFGAIPGVGQIAWFIPVGALAGVSLGFVEYIILRTTPVYGHISAGEILVNVFYMVFFVGLGEELLFRGLIQNDLSRLFGWRWGLILGAAFFSIMHITWRSVPELFFVFIAGLLFGWLYLKTRGLYLSILVHGANDVVLMAVYPYLVGAGFSYKAQLWVWGLLTGVIRR
jgi:hypothetical protein